MKSALEALNRKVTFVYNKVYIIQSLAPDDIKTGEKILDTFQFDLMKKGYSADLDNVYSRQEFMSLLNRIAAKTSEGELPLLHLEIHGHPKGLVMENGNCVTWSEAAEAFRQINIGCRNNLFVVLAVCSGANLWTAHDIQYAASFYGLIGATGVIDSSEIRPLFVEFYRIALIEEQHDRAMKLLLQTDLKSGAKFQLQVSENLFLEEIQSINNRTLDFDRFKQYQGSTTNRAERRKNQRQHEQKVTKKLKKDFYKYKKAFFMEDLYPENRNRFDFTYEDTRTLSQFEFMHHPDLPIPKNLRPY